MYCVMLRTMPKLSVDVVRRLRSRKRNLLLDVFTVTLCNSPSVSKKIKICVRWHWHARPRTLSGLDGPPTNHLHLLTTNTLPTQCTRTERRTLSQYCHCCFAGWWIHRSATLIWPIFDCSSGKQWSTEYFPLDLECQWVYLVAKNRALCCIGRALPT